MGGELLSPSPDNKKEKPVSASRIFEEQCPVYMSYGMSYEDYWNGDNELPRYYRELAAIRVKERDYHAWLTGLYFYSALARVYPLFNALSKDKPEPYLDLPLTYEMDMKKEREREKDKAIMESWRNFMRDIMEADKLKQKEGGADDAGTGKP